ncbi:hypothetical protein GCM10010406_37140 [Streptomyces thermolineatus]|uniref:Uncharacterized protein n=1 Tax=Streptomyces thermolineatus TaxID=44033 RepID=A0ABP5ZE17_9ACTN
MGSNFLNAAANGYTVDTLTMVLVGVFVVAMLLAAFWYDRWLVVHKPPSPHEPQPRSGAWQTREEYGRPTPSDHGPGHQDGDPVEYESYDGPHPEMPRDGHRYLPEEIAAMRNTVDETERRQPSVSEKAEPARSGSVPPDRGPGAV